MTAPRLPRIPTVGGKEVRIYSAGLEARDDAGSTFTLTGNACATGVLYSMSGYEELVAPGSFADTLSRPGGPDVMLLLDHGSSGSGLPLARSTVRPGPGHLALSEAADGLRVFAQLDKSDEEAQMVVRKIQSGLLASMSFAFRVKKQEWNSDRTIRTLQELDIHKGDVSVVGSPANHATTVDARSRRPGRGGNLSLYQYRLRAIQMRDIKLRNEAGRRRPW